MNKNVPLLPKQKAIELTKEKFVFFPGAKGEFTGFWSQVYPSDVSKYNNKDFFSDFTDEEKEEVLDNQIEVLSKLEDVFRITSSGWDIQPDLRKIAEEFFLFTKLHAPYSSHLADDSYPYRAMATDLMARWLFYHPQRDSFLIAKNWVAKDVERYGYEAFDKDYTRTTFDIGLYISKKLEDGHGIDMLASRCETMWKMLCLTAEQRTQINSALKERKQADRDRGIIEAHPIKASAIKAVFDAKTIFMEETGATGWAASAFAENPYPSSIKAGRDAHGFKGQTFSRK